MVQRIDTGIVDSVSNDDGELIYKVQLRSGLLLDVCEDMISPRPQNELPVGARLVVAHEAEQAIMVRLLGNPFREGAHDGQDGWQEFQVAMPGAQGEGSAASRESWGEPNSGQRHLL